MMKHKVMVTFPYNDLKRLIDIAEERVALDAVVELTITNEHLALVELIPGNVGMLSFVRRSDIQPESSTV